MSIKFPLHVGGSGSWLYDANDRFIADCSHSKYTCEQVRQHAIAIAQVSEERAEFRREAETLRARCIELEKDMAIFAGTAKVIGDACDRAGIQAGGYLGDRVAVLASTLLHQQGVTKAMSDLSVRLERERDALAAQVAHLPEGARVERDFDFDRDAQEHIPKITIYLPSIPAFGGLQQSWEQRDKIAAILAAAQQPAGGAE